MAIRCQADYLYFKLIGIKTPINWLWFIYLQIIIRITNSQLNWLLSDCLKWNQKATKDSRVDAGIGRAVLDPNLGVIYQINTSRHP